MTKTIVRRLLIMIPQLAILSVLIFLLAQLMPGDALRGLADPATHTAEDLQAIREALGLNDPWPVQYTRWIRGMVFEGDFGRSLIHGRPVISIMEERLMNTVRLSLLTSFFIYLIALPLGIIAARNQGRVIDRGIMIYTFIALSMPTVVMALINILFFGFNWGMFPIMGSIDIRASAAGGLTAFFSRLHHLILPAITLAIISTVSIIYFLRNQIIDNETSDFVTTARSKGVPEGKVYTRHILRSSLIPIAGGFATVIIGAFSGSVFIETMFSYPGMGELFITSILGRDFPVANILIMFYAIMGVLTILLTDIILTVIDPRIRIK